MANMNRMRFTVECDQTASCSVFFEPEGAEVVLKDGNRLTVEISGGEGSAEPEITYTPRGLVIWAWAGADTAVWDRSGRKLNV